MTELARSSPEAASFDSARDDVYPTPVAERRPGPPSRRASRLAYVSYAAVCIFWGTSGPAIRHTTWFIAPLWTVVIRFAIAGCLLWVGLTVVGRRPPLSGVLRVIPSALALAASNSLVTFGFQRVEAGAGTLLLATTAVTFAVVDHLWPGGKDRQRISDWIGLGLGLAGVAVLVLGRSSESASHWSGFVMLAISAWVWALGSVAQARRPSGLDPFQSSAWQMLIAAACVLPAALISRAPFPTSVAPEGLISVGFLIVTASLIGFVSFVHMMRHMPAHIVGTYSYVNVIVAALTSRIWLNERLDVRFFAAAALVLSGVTVIQRRERASARRDAKPRESDSWA